MAQAAEKALRFNATSRGDSGMLNPVPEQNLR